jgi:hypothetical protein
MNCPVHPSSEVVGYCSVCGDLGCAECVTEHEGALYCQKHAKPFKDELERRQKHDELLHKPERQRLVVRFLTGETMYGICFALNVRSDGFHLDLVDKKGQPQGKTQRIVFRDLKAVYYVKSFDGNFDRSVSYRDPRSLGAGVVVEFKDGEVLRGQTYTNYSANHPRFYVAPEDANSNNISVLVEREAVAGIFDPNEYKEQKHHDLEKYVEEHAVGDHGREECVGDYYFENHDYQHAIKHYRAQVRESGETPRLHKKIVSAQYNIGINHIKAHHYERALEYMEAVLVADPLNEKARHKAAKLKLAIDRRRKRKVEHSPLD